MAKKKIAKKLKGRPTIYTEKLVDEICQKIGLGASLRSILKEKGMPEMQTVWRWLREKPNFSERYVLATKERTEAQTEMLLEMGDEAIADAKNTHPQKSNAVVSAHKLKADNLKWSMSKMKPTKYGDKIDVTSDGKALPAPIYGGKAK